MDVRFGSKGDVSGVPTDVRYTLNIETAPIL